MKQIKVNGNCSGCGLCTVNCSYLQENADGNAEFIAGKSISDNDLEAVKKVISECPQDALKLVDTSSTNKKGKEGVQEIIAKLKKECESFNVPRITERDIPFRAKDYPIPIPHTNKGYRSDYGSYGSARSAAKEEIDRLCCSTSAYRPMLKKVFVEYKVKYLKPYYTTTDTEESAYFKYNCQIRELLANTYTEITEIAGDIIHENWKNFEVQLSKYDGYVDALRCFEDRSENSGIITQLKEMGFHSAEHYISDISIEYDEEYCGEGMFGKSKYKKKYYFTEFSEAAGNYIDNLTWAISMQEYDITEDVTQNVNWTLECFEKKVKEELNKKISELEGCLNGKNQNVGNSSINTVIAAMIDQVRGER